MLALFRSLARFLPLPLAFVMLNIIVDPVRVAGGDDYERSIAKLLLARHGVTNIANPKDAAVVRFVIEGMREEPAVIVLGSSRSKLVRSRAFGTRAFFNNSVSGGGLIDYFALYRLYRERGFAPKLVVLEMSPWVLEPAYASIWEDRYPAKADLEREVREGVAPRTAWGAGLVRSYDRLREIISPGYFQTSLMTWVRQVRLGQAVGSSVLPFELGEVPLGETMLSDGSVIYAENALNDSERQRVRGLAIKYAASQLPIPHTLVPDRIALLEAFVQRVRRDGAQVVLYLPPYHPEAYDRMIASTDNRLLPDVERAIRGVAERTDSATIGSFDPRAIGFTEDDFFDGSHPDADAVARLFAGRGKLGEAGAGAGAGDGADAGPGDLIIAGITNGNGVETVSGRPFFWIGQGPACVNMKASADGWARVSFSASPGPSLPETMQRRLLVSSSASAETQIVSIDSATTLSVVVPVTAGVTEACFTSLDKPTVARQSNGDGRPLLVGAAAPRVAPAEGPEPPTPAPAPAPAVSASAAGAAAGVGANSGARAGASSPSSSTAVPASPSASALLSASASTTGAAPGAAAGGCRVEFGQGWHGAEVDGVSWRRWMAGPAELIITAAAPANAVLSGAAVAATRPDRVDIAVNGKPAGGFDLVDKEWGFRPFPIVSFHVSRGTTRLTLRPKNPPVTPQGDPRALTVALQNLHITLEGAPAPCDVRQ